jgi:hypothetical protein
LAALRQAWPETKRRLHLIATIPLIQEVLRSPRVRIACFGNEYNRSAYQTFSTRHPKFPLMGFKTFGVALRRTDEPFTGGRYKTLRYNARSAEKLGYRTREINPDRYLKEIMAVNLSSTERQGRVMSDTYTNEEAVRRYNKNPGPWYGVFDKEGELRAYCHAPIIGGCFVYSRIIGDKSKLRDGIIYLMVRDTITAMQPHLARFGYPEWAMYDTFIGASAGLRQFKRAAGFAPARVRWRWIDAATVQTATPEAAACPRQSSSESEGRSS